MPFPTYAKQEDVPEAFRSEYEERDGKWQAKVDGELELERRKKAELLDEKKKEEKRREAVERERDELKRAADAKAGNISDEQLQKLRAEDAEKRKAELDPVLQERDTLKAKYRKARLHDRVQTLALANGVLADRIEDAMLLLDARTDLTDADGIVVKDKEGKVTTEKVEDFLKTTFRKEKPWLYAGSGGSGGGSGGPGGGGNPPPEPDKNAAEERRRQIANAL